MKNTRIVLPLAVLLLATPARADDDPWLGKDKAIHFASSTSLAAGGYVLGLRATKSRADALLLAGGFSFGLGIAKETWDLMGHGDPSWKDLTWDAIGSLVGAGIALTIHLLVANQ